VYKTLLFLATALFTVACGNESAVVDRFAGAAPPPTPRAAAPPPATPTQVSPPSDNTLVLAGDVNVDDPDADVVVVSSPETTLGRDRRLRIELRHREGGSSQPDAVLVFLNVPARPGTYTVHSPERTLVPSRVYAFVTTRGEAVGSLKGFNSAVSGSLTLRRDAETLVGTFRFSAQEPPPPSPLEPLPGELAARPAVGTIPPEPPGRLEASGRLLAMLPEGVLRAVDERPIPGDPVRRRPAPPKGSGQRGG